MKHLFYIHSWITYIVSISVISELALDHDSVVFIYGRGFRHQDYLDIATVSLPPPLMALSKAPSYGERFFYIKRYYEIKQLDNLIDELLLDEEFSAYVPLTKNYLMQLIATHARCRNLIFIEEGLLSYTGNFNKSTSSKYTNDWRGKLAALARFPNHGNRSFFYRPYRYTRPIPIYMLHAAPDIGNLGIDARVLKSVVVPPLNPEFRLDNSCLLVVETVVDDRITSKESYLRVLQILAAALLDKKIATVWIRFRSRHPVEADIVGLFEKYSIKPMILPDEACAESIFYYSKNLTVVGLHSSLLFYAAIWGCRSYSLLGRLFEIDPEAERKYQISIQLPSIFYNQVNKL